MTTACLDLLHSMLKENEYIVLLKYFLWYSVLSSICFSPDNLALYSHFRAITGGIEDIYDKYLRGGESGEEETREEKEEGEGKKR